jgi:thiol-disulfide isomerase/thioredoxin
MKKSLLICFLVPIAIGIGLMGSATIAQVADSPPTGVDTLHRFGDPHRGGETRPDTFPPGSSLVDMSDPAGQRSVSSSANGGRSKSADTLRIGDQIPEGITFNLVLNNDDKPLDMDRLSQEKYTVLALWSTDCHASLSALVKLDSLQEKFSESVNFVPVTLNSSEQVKEVLSAYKSTRNLSLPIVTGERRLHSAFPHIYTPHMVVLDKSGEIIAITDQSEITEFSLSEMVKNGRAEFRTKVDVKIPFHKEQPLINGNHQIEDKNIQFQSALTGYIPGLKSSVMRRGVGSSYTIKITNSTLLELYRTAFNSSSDYFGNNRIELVDFAPNEVYFQKGELDFDEWARSGGKLYGYELVVPLGSDANAWFQEDLRRYFPHIEATVEIRTKKVYSLERLEGWNFPPSVAEVRHHEYSYRGLKAQKSYFVALVNLLNIFFQQNSPYPFVDNTGVDYEIDFEVSATLADTESLRHGLHTIGLDIVLREQEMPVLVVRKLTGNIKTSGQ